MKVSPMFFYNTTDNAEPVVSSVATFPFLDNKQKRATKQPPSTNTKTKLDLIDSRDFRKPPLSEYKITMFFFICKYFRHFFYLY